MRAAALCAAFLLIAASALAGTKQKVQAKSYQRDLLKFLRSL